jgi:hypothetical protein
MDGVRVADDLGLVVADLLQELERELDLDALGDGGLFDLQAGGGGSGVIRTIFLLTESSNEVLVLDLFCGDAHLADLLDRCGIASRLSSPGWRSDDRPLEPAHPVRPHGPASGPPLPR